MSIYKGLAECPSGDLDEHQISLCAEVLRQYIIEDNLVSGDEQDDETLERLMNFATKFFQRQKEIMSKFAGDVHKMSDWQREMSPILTEHAKLYQDAYQPLSHLAGPPYHVYPWALACMTDIAIELSGIESPRQYDQAPRAVKESIAYTLRFGENLITQAYLHRPNPEG